MVENYAILPCNGLDKCAGIISGELAKKLCENGVNEIMCPVFSRIADAKYSKIVGERALLVIDGCATRCASKLAAEKNFKVSKKITVTEEAKNHKIVLKSNLRLLENENTLIELILTRLNNAEDDVTQISDEKIVSYNFEYETFENGKFIFRVPKNSNIFFNENDCWALVIGNHARIGVTDFVQQNLSDILYFAPPIIGAEIDQFGDVGEIESSKSVFELISPVSGKVVAINETIEKNRNLSTKTPMNWAG